MINTLAAIVLSGLVGMIVGGLAVLVGMMRRLGDDWDTVGRELWEILTK